MAGYIPQFRRYVWFTRCSSILIEKPAFSCLLHFLFVHIQYASFGRLRFFGLGAVLYPVIRPLGSVWVRVLFSCVFRGFHRYEYFF